MNRLERTDKETLKRTLRARPGYEYNQADDLIDQASYLFPLWICDEDVFRNLILSAWVFAVDERPRTLEAIVHRLRESGRWWRDVTGGPPGRPASWYEKVQALQDDFKWDRVGPLFITPVEGWRQDRQDHGSELTAAPTASLYVVSGVHCSLAAMTAIEEGAEHFRPVEAILLLPRVVY